MFFQDDLGPCGHAARRALTTLSIAESLGRLVRSLLEGGFAQICVARDSNVTRWLVFCVCPAIIAQILRNPVQNDEVSVRAYGPWTERTYQHKELSRTSGGHKE